MKDRHDLPQIPQNKISEFVEFCRRNGVEAEWVELPLRALKSSQKEVNKSKIQSLLKAPEALASPLIVSNDRFIVDGHHRWIARGCQDIDGSAVCLQIHAPQDRAIELGHDFDGSFTMSVHEMVAMYRDMVQ